MPTTNKPAPKPAPKTAPKTAAKPAPKTATKPAPKAAPKPAKKEAKQEEIARVDLLDVLLDENNTAPIFMFDEKGRQLEFEQVAVIPYGEEDLYCILKPITKLEGIKDDEAIVFKVEEDKNGEAMLRVETNEQVAISIFDQYYNLVEEETKKAKKSTKKSAK